MKTAIIVFPGSNRDRDMFHALELITGARPQAVWHTETSLPDADLVIVPGGFSYGDYLRSGAIAARSPILKDLVRKADAGVNVLGVCNGFQILTEAGLLPGALMRNAGIKFVCKEVKLQTVNDGTRFSSSFTKDQVWRCPVAHHDGNYFAEADELKTIEDNGQVIFRYADGTNPNGSVNDIAGLTNKAGNVLGMMPHPENLVEELNGGTDGRLLFESLVSAAA
ncbi:phosphoribosylformylglycinamidine synthase subunit PurQ [Roseibium sp. CAU 1637]|uniref:Phosphoribosylformylglycinamidine synthase subunit PurQ n=1 Tax=Roseibium limicola TaxID=2816037 RepID=A0A939EM30_9HYPH|nr:phosphoribosylformylglycinamidine synthase subunit PurQ [Roseibium limicola]MBO0344937.1 phosphoribosylformylglycinamidine synthase subunit PurQ [Roseibium limicola]